MFFASLFGIVINQSCFIWGLSLTSPINASIITTSLPILTMVLAAIVLREPITKLKVSGVFLGAVALILIFGGHSNESSGLPAGDILVICAQLSFTLYLVMFKGLISKYSPITLMKWMFTYASICIIPFTYTEFTSLKLESLSAYAIWGTLGVVVGYNFSKLSSALSRATQPQATVTAMYNYLQPIVASIVAVAAGLGVFSFTTAIAILLVFSGVFLVTRSKSREDLIKEQHPSNNQS